MRFGFFDSGIGGLTVLADAAGLYRDCEFVYYGDVLHAPYGTKDRESVLGYTLRAAETLDAEHIDALVVACNTATSIAVRRLREIYSFPVIGMEPALKPALAGSDGQVLVLATDLTLKESKFNYLVDTFDARDRVIRLAMGDLVLFAERGEFDSPAVEEYIRSRLSTVDLSGVSSVVLGCTHFMYFRRVLAGTLPGRIQIFDGNMGTVRHAADLAGVSMYDSPRQFDPGSIRFFLSGILLDSHCRRYYEFRDAIAKYTEGKVWIGV